MSVKRGAPVQQLDPAVEATLADPIYGSVNRKKARRTEGQKNKAVRDKVRAKVTYDWPEELADRITAIARDEKVPANQLAALLVMAGLEMLDAGKIDIRSRKYPARSPRFEFFVRLGDD